MSKSLPTCPRCEQTLDAESRFCPFCGAAQAGTNENLTPTASVRGAGSAWETILERLREAITPKYDVLRVLGYGGMAGVYLAEETRLQRKVAIKVMSPGLMIDPKLVERFEQEARTMAQLNHPHVVSIYEIDRKDDLHYFAMTYVQGRTLSQVMADTRDPLPEKVIRAWLWQVGSALVYAHQRGIIHRDVKPENILLDRDGNALVTDFGIAKVADSPGLTRTGLIVGTPAYMSPEQCSGGSLTGSSDQYSLGAVAYQMLVGEPPFVGPTLAVLQSHVGEAPRRIRDLRPDCPVDLAEAVHRMLEKRPDERFSDMSAALAALGAAPLAVNDPVAPVLRRLARHARTISISGVPDALAEGEQHTIEAVAVDDDGEALEDRKVRWASSDPNVAAVDEAGVLRAIGAGTTQLTARSSNAQETLQLTVVPGMVERIEVVPSETDVSTGESLQLRPIVHRDGRPSEGAAVAWATSDPAIARVSPEGIVEGVGSGSATISASVGGKTAETLVRVRRAAPARTPTPAPTRKPARAESPKPAAAATGGDRRKPVVLAAVALVLVALVGTSMVVFGGDRGDAVDAPLEPATVASSGAVGTGTGEVGPAGPGGGGDGTATQAGVLSSQPTDPGVGTDPGEGDESVDPLETAVEPERDGTLVIAGGLPDGARLIARAPDGRSVAVTGQATALAPGSWDLRLEAPGYRPEQAQIRVRPAETTRWVPSLTPNPVRTEEPAPTPTREPVRAAEPEEAQVEGEAVPEEAPEPAPDPAAERAAAEAEIRGVIERLVAAIDRRDVDAALPAFQSSVRDGWRQLLTFPGARDWRAELNNFNVASLDENRAEVTFDIRTLFRTSAGPTDERSPQRGLLERTGSGWQILYIEPDA